MRYTRILPSALAIAANMVSSSLAAPIASMLSSAPRAASNISLAPPSPSLTARIKRKDMRSCTVKDHLLWVSYSVWIGIPYDGGAVCDFILDAIGKPISFYKMCRRRQWTVPFLVYALPIWRTSRRVTT